MKELFFTRGEFAKLCKTTKETLRHYDNIGLFKPEKIKDNGYKYYSARQFIQFVLITTLKSTGCSLEEIKEYISKPEKADFKQLLSNQLEEVLIEKRNIERRENIIRNSIKKFDVLDGKQKINEFYIKEEEEEYFIVTSVEDSLSDLEWSRAINKHFNFCNERMINIEYQFSYIAFLKEEKKDNIWFIASKVQDKVESDRFYIKPKGKYLKMIRIGRYDPDKIYKDAKAYAKKNALKIKGLYYESEVSTYMGDDIENYILEISIEIE